MVPKKIAILGITGAGKSTLARRIAEKTKLPLFHMDTLFWRGKWEEVPEAEYLANHEKILKENSAWIIDGWLNEKMVQRLKDADLILYLDYPGWLVAVRYIERSLAHRKVARPELPKESRDRFKLRRFFLSLFRGERPEIEETIHKAKCESKVVRLTSMKETEKYVQSVF